MSLRSQICTFSQWQLLWVLSRRLYALTALPVHMLFLLSVWETVLSRHWMSALESFINLCKSAPERFKTSFTDFMSAEIRGIFLKNTFGCLTQKVFPISNSHLLEVYLCCIFTWWAGNTHFECTNTSCKIVWKIIIEACAKPNTSTSSKNSFIKYLITVLKC